MRDQQNSGAERRTRPERNSPDWIYCAWGVAVIVAAYSAIHIGLRLVASWNLGEDDPFENILVQELRLGYTPGQPPLNEWALWAVQQVIGPNLLSFQLVKYAFLVGMAVFLFHAARRILRDPLWALLTIDSMALSYQITWRFHEGLANMAAAMCATAAFFWAFLRLIDNGRTRDFLLLGLVVGLGVLTKFMFAAFVVLLLVAAMFQPSIRVRVFRPASALTLAIAMIVAAPHYWWLLFDGNNLNMLIAGYRIGADASHLELALKGLASAVKSPILLLSPLILILPLLFRDGWKALAKVTRLRPNQTGEPDIAQLILHVTLLAVVFLCLRAVIFAIDKNDVHNLFPLFLTMVVWLMIQMRGACKGLHEVRRFVIATVAIALFAYMARAANLYLLEPFCKTCRWAIPYEELAAELRARGFRGGSLVVVDKDTGGNLRAQFPRDRIVSPLWPLMIPAETERSRSGDIAIVWSDSYMKIYSIPLKKILPRLRPHAPGLTLPELQQSALVRISWRHPWKPIGYRHSEWRVLVRKHPVRGIKDPRTQP